MRPRNETREAQAAREVGHTEVSRGVSAGLSGVFLLLLLAVSSSELLRDARDGSGSPWAELAAAPARARQVLEASGLLAGNRRLLASMTAFEDAIEEASAVTARVLPSAQHFLTRRLSAGNEQVVVGRRGWLYFRPALDYLAGPGFLDAGRLARASAGGKTWQPPPRPDPLPAIADFGAQLAERGVGLVVVVTPVKAALHPEGLAPAVAEAELPLENPSFGAFLERLAALEIPAYAPGARLATALRARSWPQFLRTDTHWTPQGMETAAEGLAEFLARHVALPERHAVRYVRREVWTEGRGDLQGLLRLPAGQRLFPPERVLTRPVLQPSGEPWRPEPGADILVLGDSFTNMYSQAELGWGEGAGLAEQLSYRLQRPLDKLAVNAGGPSAARERLALQAAAGEDRLAGKRLVVYQFSARELSSGDWRLVDLARPGAETQDARHRPERGVPARGFAAWESSRSGDWRIWSRRLEGSAPRQLSPDEPGRQHCCTHISPDGVRLVYLSRSVPRDEYPELEVPGELRLLRLDGGAERTLAADARPYGWGNRAVVWRNDQELTYIDAEGRTRLLDVDTGRATLLVRERQRKLAWLVDATLEHAVKGGPVFSRYDRARSRVVEAERFPGCEPYFSHDGRFGFWVRGGGGPFHWIDLRSQKTGVLLEKDDPRIPDAQRYAYFPMLSRDGRMLAFGASRGDHDHAFSNYDIFAAPVDPGSLALTGRPLRLTAHPASDRYPDVHVDELDAERWGREAPPVAAAPPAAPVAAAKPFVARATLQACSRVPSLREISPYRAALIVCEWSLDELLAGERPDARLRVAHWALRDAERQRIASLAPGTTARLEARPPKSVETEGYPLFDTLPAAPLPVHYAEGP
jgi:alginate O-acetyltransferase complex protein AlgJ